MLSFLKLLKLENIILVAFSQLCIKYGLFQPFEIAITLNGFGIALLIIATMSIMAAGNIIITLHEKKAYGISEKSANVWFIVLNVIGVFIGFYLSNMIGRPGFAALFIITSGIFYLYATYLKEILLVKNLMIALLVVLSLLVIPIFDLLPAITDSNQAAQSVIFSIILDYALFAFVIVVIRELVKDCIHIDRDHSMGLKTIPIVLGTERSAKLISVLTLIPMAMIVYYMYAYLFNNSEIVMVILLFLIAPLLFFMFKIWNSKTTIHFKRMSFLLKGILFMTSISLLLYQYILLP